MSDNEVKATLACLPNGTLLKGGMYRITRFIGSGGFGCTYEAIQKGLDERVAVKEFFVKDFCNRDSTTAHITVGTESKRPLVDKMMRKFIGEAKTIIRLKHNGIVKVRDVFTENGTAYYVMDYIDGCSLSELISRRGHLDEAEALRYIRQICEALKFVHDHNCLHLDIKPGNIMIGNDGKAILIDFGTAKQYDEVSGENTTTLMGKTPGYAPPEQMSNSVGTFYKATDIYALGATLYKMLTGITPPDSSLLASEQKELTPLPATVSPATRAAVTAAMQLSRKKRPQSIPDFLSILDSSPEKDEETVIDTPETTVYVTPQQIEPKPEPKKKGKDIWKIAIAVAALAIIVIGWGLWQYNQNDDNNNNSQGVTQNISKTVERLRKAAAQGDSDAQFQLGICYDEGLGVEQDHTKAMEWYNKAAAQGNADAQNILGVCYAEGRGVERDYDKAVELFRKAAAQGNAGAQFQLGYCYAHGQGVEQDYDKAVEWYRKAAAQGEAAAQCNLGYCYMHGQGVEQDYAKAVEWWRKSAEQGYTDAQNNLGICYDEGLGVEQDHGKAVEWYGKAAAQGNADAQYNLGMCYYEGQGFEQDYAKAVEWYRKAAAQGHAAAQCILGYCYVHGRGVERNNAKAVDLFRKSAAQGNETAQKNLRIMGESY